MGWRLFCAIKVVNTPLDGLLAAFVSADELENAIAYNMSAETWMAAPVCSIHLGGRGDFCVKCR